MNTFINRQGKGRVIRNLRPVLEYSRKCAVTHLTVTGNAEGALFDIRWADGARAVVQFASFQVCKDFATHPRRVWHNDSLILSINQ